MINILKDEKIFNLTHPFGIHNHEWTPFNYRGESFGVRSDRWPIVLRRLWLKSFGKQIDMPSRYILCFASVVLLIVVVVFRAPTASAKSSKPPRRSLDPNAFDKFQFVTFEPTSNLDQQDENDRSVNVAYRFHETEATEYLYRVDIRSTGGRVGFQSTAKFTYPGGTLFPDGRLGTISSTGFRLVDRSKPHHDLEIEWRRDPTICPENPVPVAWSYSDQIKKGYGIVMSPTRTSFYLFNFHPLAWTKAGSVPNQIYCAPLPSEILVSRVAGFPLNVDDFSISPTLELLSEKDHLDLVQKRLNMKKEQTEREKDRSKLWWNAKEQNDAALERLEKDLSAVIVLNFRIAGLARYIARDETPARNHVQRYLFTILFKEIDWSVGPKADATGARINLNFLAPPDVKRNKDPFDAKIDPSFIFYKETDGQKVLIMSDGIRAAMGALPDDLTRTSTMDVRLPIECKFVKAASMFGRKVGNGVQVMESSFEFLHRSGRFVQSKNPDVLWHVGIASRKKSSDPKRMGVFKSPDRQQATLVFQKFTKSLIESYTRGESTSEELKCFAKVINHKPLGMIFA